MNSILLFLAGLLALVMGTLFAAPYFVDWNDYRDVFEAQATKLIGRKVDVGGDVSLTLLPAPVLRFETINVADAKGSFDTPFASARSFTVWLSMPPLLRGAIEARSVEIDRPVINLRIAGDGSGNWSDISAEAVDLPFIPKDVALNSVEISGATINFWRGNSEPDSVVEQLDGELSARSLLGPYKFAGQFTLDGKRRDLRFSTGRKDEKGEFRLKASLRSPDVNETFSIDGSVRGFGAIPVFKGEFSARLADETAHGETVGDDKKAPNAAPFEIKSKLFAGFTGAQFNEVELVVTRNDKPQTVRGLLDIGFDKGLVVGGTFSSRWVDLDSWVGSGEKTSPGLNTALAGLAGELLRRASGVREGTLRLFLDQAVLAGDLATNVQVTLSAADNKLEISRLSARLPGENRLRLKGVLTNEEGGAFFRGPVTLNGNTVSRLLKWAGVASEPNTVTQPGEFLLKGELSVGPDIVSLKAGEGTLFGSTFTGAFTYRGGEAGEVSVSLKSDRMDLGRVLGSNASAKSLWSLLPVTGRKKDGDGARADASPGWLDNLRAAADVKIGAVTFAGLGESALEAKFSLAGGALDIRQLTLSSGSGVSIQAGGRLTGLGDNPQGNITLALRAENGEALSSLGEFLEMPNIAKGSADRLTAMTPVQITAAIRSTALDSKGLDVQLEGSLGKSDLLVKLGLEGVPADWTASSIVLQSSLTNGSGIELLQQLSPYLKQSDLTVFKAGAGSVSLEASGVPDAGLQTKMVLNAGGANWIAEGVYRVQDAGDAFSGTTAFNALTTAAGLSLFGVRGAPGHGSEPGSFTAGVESKGGVTSFSNLKGTIGGANFTGEGQVDMSRDRPVVTARIKADGASLPRLLAPLTGWQAKGGNSQEIRGVSDVDGYWPDVPFNTSLLGGTDGSFSLTTERLRLTGALVLEQAKIKANLSHGTLRVTALEGELYGGTFKASGELAARGDGMALDAKAAASGLRLERVMRTSKGGALVNAPTDLAISLKGEGLTPRGLVSSLSGSGKFELGAGKITGFSLGAAHAAAISAQRKKSLGGVDEAELGRRVAENLKNSEMSFSPINAPFSVNNGVLEFDKIALSDADGRVTITSYLQLSTLELDSEWALQSAQSAGRAKPRVSLVFSGALKDMGKLQPKIDTTGLARYVTIRKMEQDVERLENLDVSGKRPIAGSAPTSPPEKTRAAKPKPPVRAAAPPVEAVSPQPVRKPPPALAPAQSRPPAAPPVAAVVPQSGEIPPVAAIVPAPVKPQPAPLPRRKPPVPPALLRAPGSATVPLPELPWLQSVTPLPAPPETAQAPIQLPVPEGVSGSAAIPPQGQITPDTQPAAPPPVQRPAPRFDPFAEGAGN